MLALAGAGLVRAQAPPALKFRGLDHIEFTVADVEKSTAFYAQLFGGADVMKNRTTTRRYLKLGSSYMAIDKADAPRIDHACIGIENFDIATVHAYLTAQGLTYRDYPSGRDTGVNDPDGTRLQLSSADGWPSLAAQTASPEPSGVVGIFEPMGLFRVDIKVSNLAVAFTHYLKLLRPVVPSRGIMVGQGRLDFYNGPPGYRGFAVQVRRFDLETVRTKLQALGARLAPEEAKNVVQFLDPDGFNVEVAHSVRLDEPVC
jgi:catechol 2,3-dioxygenase-like lactoylglutathione lyase family enzyme